MSHISTNQNKPSNLKLLAAQRQLYLDAKHIRRWRVGFSILLALLCPFLLFFLPDLKTMLAVISGAWLLLSKFWLEDYENLKIKHAASTQEIFDVNVFGLPYNNALVKSPASPEVIHGAADRFSQDINDFKEWYADPANIQYPINVLLCQRVNFVWDQRLRRKYGTLVASLTICYVIATIIFAALLNITVTDYIVGIFLPALSALLQGRDTAVANLTIAKEKEQKEHEILEVWESSVTNPESITIDTCRKVQDVLYQLRSSGPLVPEWFYKKYKPVYESNMRSVIKEFSDRVQPEKER